MAPSACGQGGLLCWVGQAGQRARRLTRLPPSLPFSALPAHPTAPHRPFHQAAVFVPAPPGRRPGQHPLARLQPFPLPDLHAGHDCHPWPSDQVGVAGPLKEGGWEGGLGALGSLGQGPAPPPDKGPKRCLCCHRPAGTRPGRACTAGSLWVFSGSLPLCWGGIRATWAVVGCCLPSCMYGGWGWWKQQPVTRVGVFHRTPVISPRKRKYEEDERQTIPNVLQGEVARLNPKFLVNLDPSHCSNNGTVHLICKLGKQPGKATPGARGPLKPCGRTAVGAAAPPPPAAGRGQGGRGVGSRGGGQPSLAAQSLSVAKEGGGAPLGSVGQTGRQTHVAS